MYLFGDTCHSNFFKHLCLARSFGPNLILHPLVRTVYLEYILIGPKACLSFIQQKSSWCLRYGLGNQFILPQIEEEYPRIMSQTLQESPSVVIPECRLLKSRMQIKKNKFYYNTPTIIKNYISCNISIIIYGYSVLHIFKGGVSIRSFFGPAWIGMKI